MIQMMLDREMEETRRLLQPNKDEPTMPIKPLELNIDRSMKGTIVRLLVKLNIEWVGETTTTEGMMDVDASIRISWHLSR